jgi:hypothetical protein
MEEFQHWLSENPMPDLKALIEAPGRRLAAARDEPYDPVKHRPGWEEITAVHDEFDRALADWRRRYFEWQWQRRHPHL